MYFLRARPSPNTCPFVPLVYPTTTTATATAAGTAGSNLKENSLNLEGPVTRSARLATDEGRPFGLGESRHSRASRALELGAAPRPATT